MDEKEITPEAEWELIASRLTFKQQRFAEAFLGDARGNITEAARLAGYEGNSGQLTRTAQNLMSHPGVRRYLHERSRKAMRADEVLGIIADHARGSMEDFIDVYEDGLVRINLQKAAERGQLHLIKKLKNGKEGLEIELYDAQAALGMVCRNLGLFNDQMKMAVQIDQVIDALPCDEETRDLVRAQLAEVAMQNSGD